MINLSQLFTINLLLVVFQEFFTVYTYIWHALHLSIKIPCYNPSFDEFTILAHRNKTYLLEIKDKTQSISIKQKH